MLVRAGNKLSKSGYLVGSSVYYGTIVIRTPPKRDPM